MEITAGITAHSARHLVMQMATYRRKVFGERLGWELQAQNGLEFDQFDRDDTMYVVAQDHNGWVTGCARLLPTTRPYLLGEVFPQLMQGQPLPCTPQVWELSRFAAMDLQAPSPRPSDQFSSPPVRRTTRRSTGDHGIAAGRGTPAAQSGNPRTPGGCPGEGGRPLAVRLPDRLQQLALSGSRRPPRPRRRRGSPQRSRFCHELQSDLPSARCIIPRAG